MLNFWTELKKPIFALAPMAGVTGSAFRQICKSFGADVVYSEMASATALNYAPAKTLELLAFSEIERPYAVQLFGSKSEHFVRATKLLNNGIQCAMGDGRWAMGAPDGIDINFGCPVKKVQKQGAGAVLMDNLPLAREIIKSVIGSTDLPVSIKIRSRVGKTDALKFLDYLSDLNIKAVMIHGRTLKGGFSGPVDTKMVRKARDYFHGIILANGGVFTADDARKLMAESGADGIGIARGAMGRPWIFEEVRSKKLEVRSLDNITEVILRHARLMYKLKGEQGIIEMRKHLCWYMKDFPGARKLREKMVKVNTLEDIKKSLSE